ncbi:MAG: right-handed parallel beta-helix repeat-containing protein [Treponema sp.]|nr:right-handed parallel beta-helix repeat-containing protein [Treponema sp.]
MKFTQSAAWRAVILALVFLGACNNFFHDLIPPDGDRIISFEVPGQEGAAAICDSAVSVTVLAGTDLGELLPRVTVSPGAALFPVTFDYILAAFPGSDLMRTMLEMLTAADLTEYVHDLIRSTPGFRVPALDTPIDFSGPVSFFVISGQGGIRQYSVSVVEYDAGPRLLGLRFSKYDNPELLADSVPVFSGNTLSAVAMYPVEIPLSFALVPSFQIVGDRLEIDGVEITSGRSVIQFDARLNVPQAKTITVTRDGVSRDFFLDVTFREDPDTIRSITDFRFAQADNPGIAANSVASIINDGEFGTITLHVLYSGARPRHLVPRFISPGTVRVGGVVQSSGASGHDFSAPLEYRVVSRVGQFTRTYTVRVEFIHLVNDAPRILTFDLLQAHNPGIIRGSEGEIGDGHIIIDVHFGGTAAPHTLIPEFTAQGIVTVLGSVQVSGVSSQNFSQRITYTVTHPQIPSLRRYYSVQTRLIRDTSSDAFMISFGFFPEDNPGLTEPLSGRIQQQTITVFAPEGFGVSYRAMVPRFTATGQVSADGAAQVSGVSGRVFSGPVEYTVVSPNGMHRRVYTVNVRETASPRIFVNHSAGGHNDGTSWQNAFRCLREASEAAAAFPADEPKEIWIAAGTYRPSAQGDESAFFLLVPNTRYIGGFAGWETEKGQRNPALHHTVLSGDLGGGRRSRVLFAASGGSSPAVTAGDLFFHDLQFAGAGDAGAITARLAVGFEFYLSGAAFSRVHGNAIRVEGSSRALVRNVSLRDMYGGGISLYGVAGLVEIADVEMHNVGTSAGHHGISVAGGAGERRISGISGDGITGTGIEIEAANNSPVTVRDVNIRNASDAAVNVTGGGLVEITDVDMRDAGRYGIRIYGGAGERRVSGISGDGVTGTGIAIEAANNSPVTVSGVNVRNAGEHAVSVTGSPGFVGITDVEMHNIGTGATASGISVAGGTGERRISGVTGSGIRGTGISVSTANNSPVTVRGVNLRDVGSIAVNVTGTPGIVEIADVEVHNAGTGISVASGTGERRISGITGSGIAGNGISVGTANNSPVTVRGVNLRDVSATAVNVTGTPGIVEIADVEVHNVGTGGTHHGIRVGGGGTGERRISGVTGSNIRGWGISVGAANNLLTVSGVNLRDAGGVIVGANNSPVTVRGVNLRNIATAAVTVIGTPGIVEIADVELHNVGTGTTHHGIAIAGGIGERRISGVTGSGITGLGMSIAAPNNSPVTVRGVNLRDVGRDAIDVAGASGIVEIADVEMHNVGTGTAHNGISIRGGNNSERRVSGVTGSGIAGIGILIFSSGGSSTSVIVRSVNLRDVGGASVHVGGTPIFAEIANVTINGSRNGQTLFAFIGGDVPGILQFRPNNVINGTLLNTQQAITGMVSSGVITLIGGAMPVLAPLGAALEFGEERRGGVGGAAGAVGAGFENAPLRAAPDFEY